MANISSVGIGTIGSHNTLNPPANYYVAQTATPERFPSDVRIERAGNGWIITIGCKRFVGTNWVVISKQLGEYWENPEEAEKKYCNKKN